MVLLPPSQSKASVLRRRYKRKLEQSFLTFPEELLFLPLALPYREQFLSLSCEGLVSLMEKNLQAGTDTTSNLQPQGLHSLSPGHSSQPSSFSRHPGRTLPTSLQQRLTQCLSASVPRLPADACISLRSGLEPSALSLVQEQLLTCSLSSTVKSRTKCFLAFSSLLHLQLENATPLCIFNLFPPPRMTPPPLAVCLCTTPILGFVYNYHLKKELLLTEKRNSRSFY